MRKWAHGCSISRFIANVNGDQRIRSAFPTSCCLSAISHSSCPDPKFRFRIAIVFLDVLHSPRLRVLISFYMYFAFFSLTCNVGGVVCVWKKRRILIYLSGENLADAENSVNEISIELYLLFGCSLRESRALTILSSPSTQLEMWSRKNRESRYVLGGVQKVAKIVEIFINQNCRFMQVQTLYQRILRKRRFVFLTCGPKNPVEHRRDAYPVTLTMLCICLFHAIDDKKRKE